ncbi:hypothetical protein K457DRAFT_1906829 [Linnemannia elongata AG-77]|uniref:FAD-binding domain-containing protein n=1 Tax=Linnemannia elongata AG-77 TaxID=1314771 RepID=A0A197JY72_9FUNG|nr:hypothetical protein K457DRAFT_1906829 [Linnemannia elongata AG-77]
MSAPSETSQPIPSTSSTMPAVTPNKPPHVLIAGASLAGLFLGILLERAGIPYEIFERSSEARPHGELYQLDINCIGLVRTFIIGYDRVLFARPELQAMLLKKFPSEKIHLAKKIVTLDKDMDGVTITFDDNTTACSDILVGADGAQSAVRQHLYKTLEKEVLLPKSDTKPMSKGYISLVGMSNKLDPSVAQRSMVATPDEQATSSEWTSQDNKRMLDEIRHFKTPYWTMGDLFDATDIEKVSKIYFEDKLF